LAGKLIVDTSGAGFSLRGFGFAHEKSKPRRLKPAPPNTVQRSFPAPSEVK